MAHSATQSSIVPAVATLKVILELAPERRSNMAEPMSDSKKKVLEAQQQPPHESNNPDNNSGLVEAVAIEVTDDHHAPPPQARVVVYEYAASSTNPPVRNNSAVQCCYPITVDDPVEMVQARNVAITQVCVEILAIFFCSTEFCGVTLLLAVLSSSVVACCCKHRVVYSIWSCVGIVVGWLHAIAAAEAFQTGYYFHSYPPTIIFLLQVSLCGLSMLAVYRGCKTTTALREPIHPVERQLGLRAPVQVSMHPPVQIQPSHATSSVIP